ncbi:MAG: FecR domain-containing protein [Flavobacteriales bacterium]|nr:FecR domain-containing protein [Flavobacteriales bacterium]
MLNSREDIDALIVSYLNGEASPDQAMLLEDWKNEHPDNKEYFLKFEKAHATTYGSQPFTLGSKGSAWKVIENQIKEQKVTPLWRKPLFVVSVAAAAIITLIVVTGVLSPDDTPPVANNTKVEREKELEERENVIYASNKVAYYTLEDDSKVMLQPGSKLIIPKDFNEKNRSLSLDGSGTFEVIHDEKNPFVLMVGELEIYDLGTIFHVDHSGDTVKVSVDEGIVELKINGQKQALEKGDSAFYLVSQKVIKKYAEPSAREDVVFEFDGTSLAEATEILGAFFKRKIEIKNPALAECTVSVTFKNESLATILDIIAELLDINIVQNKKTIEIYGESCQ